MRRFFGYSYPPAESTMQYVFPTAPPGISSTPSDARRPTVADLTPSGLQRAARHAPNTDVHPRCPATAEDRPALADAHVGDFLCPCEPALASLTIASPFRAGSRIQSTPSARANRQNPSTARRTVFSVQFRFEESGLAG